MASVVMYTYTYLLAASCVIQVAIPTLFHL